MTVDTRVPAGDDAVHDSSRLLPDIENVQGGVTRNEHRETGIPGAERSAGAHHVAQVITVSGRTRRMTRG